MSGKLPIGWAECFLREVVVARKGKKPKLVSLKPSPSAHPYILIEQMEGNPPRHFTEDASVPIAEPDEVLVVWDGSIGKCARGLRGVIGSTIVALRPTGIESGYLEAFLRHIRPVLQETSRGTGLQHINPEVFWSLAFPLAPIQEQRRIVAKLEKLLGKVDRCQQRLSKISVLLKNFRQSVLAAACSGKLTADWRDERGAEMDGWKEATLEDVADLRLGKMLDKAKNVGSPTRYLRNLNVRWFAFDFADLATMRATSKDRAELAIRDGDLLVCEGGEPGRCAVWNLGVTDLIFQKAIHRVRLTDNVKPHWLAFNIRNDANSGRLESYFTGTTIKHLTGKTLSTYRFALPLLPEQQEIVQRVKALFNKADEIEVRFKKAKAFVDKLTQSIFSKAFRGELVPTEAELARRERRPYESASELLARIRSDKEMNEISVKLHHKLDHKKRSKPR